MTVQLFFEQARLGPQGDGMAFFNLFKGKDNPEANNRYTHLGTVAVAEINRFADKVGKDWAAAVAHSNFERSSLEMQIRMVIEKGEREIREGRYPVLTALMQQNKLNLDGVMFEGMTRAVARISELKMLGGFEKIGRHPDK